MMKKVYILDDDPDFVEMISYVLAKDYQVTTATELDVDGIRNFSPDLILMDNAVGSRDSLELQQELHRSIPGFPVPIILFSGHHKIAEIADREGIAGYIQKPAGIEELRQYIHVFFQQPHAMP